MSALAALERARRPTSRIGWAGILVLSLLLHAGVLVAVTAGVGDRLHPPPSPTVLSVQLIAAQSRTLSAGEATRAEAPPPEAAKAPSEAPDVPKPATPVPARAEVVPTPARASKTREPEPAEAPAPAEPSAATPPPESQGPSERVAAAPSPPSPPVDVPQPKIAAAAPDFAIPEPSVAEPSAAPDVTEMAAAPWVPAVDPRNDARLKASPPPSAVIEYQGTIGGGRYWVRMDWAHGEGRYNLSLRERHNLFGFESAGRLGPVGLIPLRYTDKRPFRSMTAANFDYETQRIRFSTTADTVPLQAGAQDLVSIALQLAAFARGDVRLLRSGVQIDMQVADTRRAGRWLWRAVADEEVATGLGPLTTLHMVRRAPEGSFENAVEVWLAADYDWLPVRIKRTDAKGKGWDLVAASISR